MATPETGQTIAAIVLAAGASRRLGQPKQLILMEGEPLLRRTTRLALEAGCAPVVVVLGAEAELCRRVLAKPDGESAFPPGGSPLRPGVWAIVNPAWREGQSSSLRAGLAALTEHSLPADFGAGASEPSRSALIMVCDQVRLTTQSLEALCQAHRRGNHPVTAAFYAGRLGVPAIFAQSRWGALGSLTGDRGARQMLEAWADDVQRVDLPEAAFDLDTPEQLLELTGRTESGAQQP